MILRPKVIVLDEPTSALDRTVQKQVIELLRRLQIENDLSYIFISHDLAVVRALSDYVFVMKDGVVVEEGPTGKLFEAPETAYTREMMRAAFDLKSLLGTAAHSGSGGQRRRDRRPSRARSQRTERHIPWQRYPRSAISAGRRPISPPGHRRAKLCAGRSAGPNGTLLMFICNDCPYVLAVLDRSPRRARSRPLGIGIAAICSNDAAPIPRMASTP